MQVKSAGERPRLIFLAHLLPWPLSGGGQIKSFHTLRILSTVFDITLVAFVRPSDDVWGAHAALKPLCAGGVKTVPLGRNRVSNAVSALSSLTTSRSFVVSRDDTKEMHRAVRQAIGSEKWAVLHADHLPMMQFVLPHHSTGKTKVVLDNHNIEHRIIARIADPENGANLLTRLYAAQEWFKLRTFEINACRRADCVLTVSEEDAQGLQAIDPSLAPKLHAVPIGVDTDYFAPVSLDTSGTASTLLSVGTLFWPPNVDGAQWFCRDILPRIQTEIPEVQLHLVGARPGKEILRLQKQYPAHVRVFGSVPDVRPFGETCGAFVVPLRTGSGLRVKILNAWAQRLPVVSTTLGAEGINGAENEKNILLADTPTDFARACVRVLRDRGFAERIARAGRETAETTYSWEAVGKRLLSVYPCVPKEAGF